MPLITGSNALNTEFTPAAGDFRVQVTAARATLWSKGTSGSAWAKVAVLDPTQQGIVNNIAGTIYKWEGPGAVTEATQ
jgi:hypothetical protein